MRPRARSAIVATSKISSCVILVQICNLPYISSSPTSTTNHIRISWKDHIPNVEILRQTNMSSIETTLTASQLRWTAHIIRMNDSRLPKAVFYGELAKGKRLNSWWTTAAIQRCRQTTPKRYTHHRRHLGDSCTRSATVEAGHSQRKEPR